MDTSIDLWSPIVVCSDAFCLRSQHFSRVIRDGKDLGGESRDPRLWLPYNVSAYIHMHVTRGSAISPVNQRMCII